MDWPLTTMNSQDSECAYCRRPTVYIPNYHSTLKQCYKCKRWICLDCARYYGSPGYECRRGDICLQSRKRDQETQEARYQELLREAKERELLKNK